MRGITGTVLTLILALYLASTIELPQAWSDASHVPSLKVSDGWRRTADGWQWQNQWRFPATTPDPVPVAWRVHPLLLAAVQVLVSLFALVSGHSWPQREITPQFVS